MEALLTPIPAIYIEDGEALFSEKERVAYGSNAWELFSKLREEGLTKGLPVLIYASSTESAHLSSQISLHKITHVATLDGFYEARGGKHERPQYRTKHALETDTGFALFWEIVGLKRLEKPANLSGVRTRRADGNAGIQLREAPRGPIRVWVIDEEISNNF